MREKLIYITHTLLRISKCLGAFFFVIPVFSFAQCITSLSNVPYNENFETSNGNWTSGGTASDWAWGAPAKSLISAAGTGVKCWITGGLNNKNYAGEQISWLKTPCFDFTNLRDPYLKFKVFWETERNNDGANLQYSLNNGISWQVLGSMSEPGSCLSENWFNSPSLINLSSQDAWSGNIQSSRPGCFISGGSAGWVTAKHNAPELAGKPNVMFRFVFATTNSCNDFDGFAIDDFSIGEAPVSIASFSYDCSSNLRVNFKNTSSLCPTSYRWDFDDPSSGADNISYAPNPTHAYTKGGKYRVSLTVSGPGNTESTFTIPDLEIIVNIAANIIMPIQCNGDTTGSLSVDFAGDTAGIRFNWDANPVQITRTAVNLGAGDYNVTILNNEGCPASAKITLVEPPPISYTLTIVKPGCGSNNGGIDIAMSGGSAPYKYSWIPVASNTSSAKNLRAGAYIITVTDNNNCNKIITVVLPDSSDIKGEISSHKDVSCFGKSDGMATATTTGGNPPYSYSWSSGGNAAFKNDLNAGNYTITITDTKGCKAFAVAAINQPDALTVDVNAKNTSCGNNNGNITVQVHGGTGPYQFTWNEGNSTNASLNNLAPGQYIVNIQDYNACRRSDTAEILPSSAVEVQLSHEDVLCMGGLTGKAEAKVTGGSAPYHFKWTNGTEIYQQSIIDNVGAGTYSLNVEDATGCNISTSVIITQPGPLQPGLASIASYCELPNGSANTLVTGGIPPYTFLWTPTGSTASTLRNVPAGNYLVTVTDRNHCSVTLLTTILNNQPTNIFLGNDTTLCPGNKIVVSPGNYSRYLWQDNFTGPAYNIVKEGIYCVQVTDDRGCVLKDTMSVIADCGFIFFPSAFTPNSDGLNDYFGPHGILNTVQDYTLKIYNRQGQLIFESNNPYKKWDGKMRNLYLTSGTFVWVASFTNKGKAFINKGTVTLVL